MKHKVDFQYRPKNLSHPLDYDQAFPYVVDASVALPAIGDHIDVDEGEAAESVGLTGVVESRTFTYVQIDGEVLCYINIVVTDDELPNKKATG